MPSGKHIFISRAQAILSAQTLLLLIQVSSSWHAKNGACVWTFQQKSDKSYLPYYPCRYTSLNKTGTTPPSNGTLTPDDTEAFGEAWVHYIPRLYNGHLRTHSFSCAPARKYSRNSIYSKFGRLVRQWMGTLAGHLVRQWVSWTDWNRM